MAMNYKNQEGELDKLLGYVLETGASDLHLVVGKPPMVRVDSVLLPVPDEIVLDAERTGELIAVLLPELHRSMLAEKKQTDFSYSFKSEARFRVNVYYQKGTLAASLRHIPTKISTLSELNLSPQLEDLAHHKEGLILFVGPTGHGKSTTLAALIDIINHSRADHIITIEDPIEYVFTPDKAMVSQREVLL